jgi:hypothetical protein
MYRAATRPTLPYIPSKAGSSEVTGISSKPVLLMQVLGHIGDPCDGD